MKKAQERHIALRTAIQNASMENEVSTFDWLLPLNKLTRWQKKLKKLYVEESNGFFEWRVEGNRRFKVESPEKKRRNRQAQESIEQSLRNIAEETGWFIRIQGDPRGCVIEVDFFKNRTESEQCSHTELLMI